MMKRSMKGIWAVILAAGESKRMGSPKMILPFKGSTMLERVISNIRASQVDKIMVVLGSDREKIQPLAEKSSVGHCYNENFTDGMFSSVKCGLRGLPEDFKAVMIFPGDQPLISTETINIIINAYDNSEKEILIPVYKGRRGHPLMFGKMYREEIDRMDPVQGLRALALNHPDDVLEIQTGDPGILKDFDTYDEYLNEINQIS